MRPHLSTPARRSEPARRNDEFVTPRVGGKSSLVYLVPRRHPISGPGHPCRPCPTSLRGGPKMARAKKSPSPQPRREAPARPRKTRRDAQPELCGAWERREVPGRIRWVADYAAFRREISAGLGGPWDRIVDPHIPLAHETRPRFARSTPAAITPRERIEHELRTDAPFIDVAKFFSVLIDFFEVAEVQREDPGSSRLVRPHRHRP